jgi:hypothetical protein
MKNKWSTEKCGRCGDVHSGYTGKFDKNNVEYVVCGNTNKRMNVKLDSNEGNSLFYLTNWIKDE